MTAHVFERSIFLDKPNHEDNYTRTRAHTIPSQRAHATIKACGLYCRQHAHLLTRAALTTPGIRRLLLEGELPHLVHVLLVVAVVVLLLDHILDQLANRLKERLALALEVVAVARALVPDEVRKA